MQIRDLMKRTDVLPPDAPISEAAKMMKDKETSVVPVGSANDLKGVVTPREIAAAAAEPCQMDSMPVEDVTKNVMGFCNEDQDLEEALKTMRTTRQLHLLVRNNEGKTVGVISLSDILEACPEVELVPG
jgi:predicted transcriptional regulator